jgi:hypothetical protein
MNPALCRSGADHSAEPDRSYGQNLLARATNFLELVIFMV